MKNLFESKNQISCIDLLSQNLNGNDILNPKSMNCIFGGDGEDNGGGDIIIIPPTIPPTTPSTNQ